MMKLKKELDKIKKLQQNVDREKLIYETNGFQTIKTFDRDIYEGSITLEKANEYQNDLLAEIIYLKKKNETKKVPKKNKKKKLLLKTFIIFLRVDKKLLTLLKAKYFLAKSKCAGILNLDYSKLKVLTPKQML